MLPAGIFVYTNQGGAIPPGARTPGEWGEVQPLISRAFYDFETCGVEAAREPHIYLSFARGLLGLGPGLELYAVEALRTYTGLRPRDPEGFKVLGAAFAALGALRDAAAAYERAAELDPADESAATAALYLYLFLKAYTEACCRPARHA